VSKRLRSQVEDPKAHLGIETARNLPDAANADESLEGYAAINALQDTSEIAQLAYKLYQERQVSGENGDADGDWFRAEEEVRRKRSALNA
jgi:hypothetical protein